MKGLLFLFLGCFVICAQGTPQSNSRIRVGFAGYPISNLYYLGFDDYSEAITSLVLEPLVHLNLDTLEPEPSLANSFSANRDHTRFEFTLDPRA
jgi:ABC-type transport system substrate-binding protein